MKIGHLDHKPAVAPAPAAGERKAAGVPGAAGVTEEASATLNLSQAAKALPSAAGDGSFDARKVDRIAQAIRNGQFKVNAEAIADKLIFNAAELLGRKPD